MGRDGSVREERGVGGFKWVGKDFRELETRQMTAGVNILVINKNSTKKPNFSRAGLIDRLIEW